MNLTSIKLVNFGHFEEISLEFEPKFNLLVGDNSAGKTTILNGIAVAIGSILLCVPEQDSRHIRPKDVRKVLINSKSEQYEESKFPVEVYASGSIFEDKVIDWSRFLNGVRRRTTTRIPNLRREFNAIEELGNLPLVAFYGSGRLWREPYDLDDTSNPKRYDGYHRAIDPRVNSSQFISWMKHQAFADMQDGQSSAYRNVCQTIAKCFVDDKVKIQYNIRRKQLEVTSQGKSVAFSHLSDGQRSVVSMVGDMAVRAVTLNPHLDERACEDVKGVVLIDEVDLHLHPKWQRKFVEVLSNSFPNVQFIATTHSPFIIQGMHTGRVINLDKPGHIETEETYNRSIEEIVKYVQGVERPNHSAEHERKTDQAIEFLQLLETPRTTQTERKLDLILEKFSDDPAANALLHFKREIKKLDDV